MEKVKLNNVHKKWQLPEKSSLSFAEACRIHPNKQRTVQAVSFCLIISDQLQSD